MKLLKRNTCWYYYYFLGKYGSHGLKKKVIVTFYLTILSLISQKKWDMNMELRNTNSQFWLFSSAELHVYISIQFFFHHGLKNKNEIVTFYATILYLFVSHNLDFPSQNC